MVRAPCCEKIGLKKGSWTAEEDRILMHHIQRYGHENWRSLPRQAGLFRCGKSCRLRWINYLRPDLKRGNFTVEEEETIITLHQNYGNRWSAIAAELPGRTDNEIKNVWHTYLKKRLDSDDDKLAVPKQKPSVKKRKPRKSEKSDIPVSFQMNQTGGSVTSTSSGGSIIEQQLPSHSSDVSSNSTREYPYVPEEEDLMFLEWPEINDNFLLPNLPADQDTIATDFPDCDDMPVFSNGTTAEDNQNTEDEMDFWLRVFIESGSTGTDSLSSTHTT